MSVLLRIGFIDPELSIKCDLDIENNMIYLLSDTN